MKKFFIVCMLFISWSAYSQPGSQKAFSKFVVAFNRREFDVIYNEFSDGFQKQVDAAVATGGLSHVFDTNGRILSAVIERQSATEGSYLAIADQGAFRILLSVDTDERIDGLRVKVVPTGAPLPPASLVFVNAPRGEHEK